MSERKKLEHIEDGLSAGWVRTTLADTCEIIMGQSPPSRTYNSEGVGLPFFQGKAEFGALYPTVQKWCSKPKKIAEAEDVLISVRAPVGPTNLCKDRSCIGRGLAAIRPLGEMPNRYFLYLFRNIENELAEKGTGSTFSAINKTILQEQEIPLAPLNEQRRIVEAIEALFSRLDAGIAALERAQANLKRYKASVLKAACEGRLVPQDPDDEPAADLLARILEERRAKWEAEQLAQYAEKGRKLPKNWRDRYQEPQPPDTSDLPELPEGWVWASLDELAEVRSGVTKGRRLEKHLTISVPYLRVANVQDGYLDLEIIKTIAIKVEELDRYRLEINDILFNEGGDRDKLGRGAVWYGEIENCVHQNHVHSARPFSEEVVPEWINLTRQTEYARDYFWGAASQTVNLASINTTRLRGLPIPLPPLNEQLIIHEEVERLTSILEEIDASVAADLTRAERLRQSILRDAFTGRLVPQDPDDEPASGLLERIQAERDSRRNRK